jgi:putative tricarboxylic transport membrane protein
MIASMYIGNLILLWMSLAMIPLFIKLVNIPRIVIYMIVFLCCIYGAYSINYNLFDIYLMIFLGCIGFFLKKAHYEFTPLILGFLIGPKLEENLRSFMQINNGDVYKLFQSNISLVFYVFILLIILYILRKKIKEL